MIFSLTLLTYKEDKRSMDNIITGKVSVIDKGFGFINVPEGDDIFISKKQILKVFDGEVVEATVIKSQGKSEGIINRVIKRKEEFLGKIVKNRDGFMVQISPFHKVEIKGYKGDGGDIIKFKITKYPSQKEKSVGQFIEIIGHENSPKIENTLAIFKHEIPNIFSKEVMKQAEEISHEISTEDRFDLTNLNFVTIDGDDSRDFDDAVYCESTSFGWSLYVGIADVAHYISESSSLDQEAFNRGNSVYFPNECIPMLPEVLSNELCSLKPKVKRYAVVVKMNITKHGNIKSFKFMNAVIESKARLTYDEVSDMLEDEKESVINKYASVYKDLKKFQKLYDVLKGNKETRGALEFEKRENKILFDKSNFKIKDVLFYNRKVSHKMIEEAMLCANICAAKLLTKLKVDALYRVHEKPKESKIETIKNILKNLGLTLRGGEKTKTHHFRKMMDIASGRKDKEFINSTLLKSMPRASYQVENKGHFGLAYDEYTHFTSPIRRYPDLVVHRAIKSVISSNEGDKYVNRISNGKGKINDHYPYDENQLHQIAAQMSMTERRADSASNEVYDSLKCHFLADKVGQSFKGKITHLTKTAMYVEFDDFIMEGMVSFMDLNDYFVFFPDQAKIKGRKTKKEYRLGDNVKFSILKVNNNESKVYLKLK